MRNNRFQRGGSRRQQGGGGGGGGRGGRNGHHRGGRGRGDGGGGRRPRNPRQAAEGGNKRERISIESGHLVLIDQFMLANPQFIERLNDIADDDPGLKDDIIRHFGGSVVEVEPGTYRIERDPFKFVIVVHPEGDSLILDEIADHATKSNGHVFVDTRCLAMIDRELLDDNALLEKYQQLWFEGQDKACRDLLRDNGGAVRYGFQRHGDDLGVYEIPGEDIICLWPDVAEVIPEEAA